MSPVVFYDDKTNCCKTNEVNDRIFKLVLAATFGQLRGISLEYRILLIRNNCWSVPTLGCMLSYRYMYFVLITCSLRFRSPNTEIGIK